LFVKFPFAMRAESNLPIDEDAFDWETRHEETPFLHHAIAGSSAGIMEHVSMFPVDTVKTRMQVSHGKLGVSEAIHAVLNERGVLGFVRGAHVMGFGCIPSHIGLFGIYEYSMSKLVDEQEPQPQRVAFCGALGALFHDVVLTPHDLVKQRLQLGRYSGALDCVTKVAQTGGVLALWKGLPAASAMNVPYTAIVTATNETLQSMFEGNSSALTTISGYFLCAGFSGGVAAALTSPLDVLKTRLQTQELSFSELIRSTYKTSGLAGFFHGTLPRICLATPAAAVSWGTYETIRLGLQSYGGSQQTANRSEKTQLKRAPSIKTEPAPSASCQKQQFRQHSLKATLHRSASVRSHESCFRGEGK